MFKNISSQAIATIVMTILSSATVFTTVKGVMRVTSSREKTQPVVGALMENEVSEIKEQETLVTKVSPRKVTLVSSESQASNSAVTNVTNPNACLIQLFGKTYDVAPLKDTHSGGNIFTCNTDMTAIYQGQHGSNVSKMVPYLVANSVSTSGSTLNFPPASAVSGGEEDAEDDREDDDEDNDSDDGRDEDKDNFERDWDEVRDNSEEDD